MEPLDHGCTEAVGRFHRLPVFGLAERAEARADAAGAAPMVGVPMLPMPTHVLEAVARAAGRVSPRWTRGWAPLRAALAEHLRDWHGLVVDPDRELLVTHGAQHGMSVALRALLAAGTEVVVPAPTYFFDGMLRAAGLIPVYVPNRAVDGWATDPDRIAAAVTDRTGALLLCNPNNPTGQVPSAAELGDLLEVAGRHDLIVLADESYARYLHEPGYVPLQSLRGRHPRVITVTSMSKNFAFTNWRIGYVHGPAALLDRVHRVFEWDAINVGDVNQAAALAALTGPQSWLDDVFVHFKARRDLLVDLVEAAGFSVVRPPAGIFAFADLGTTGASGRALETLLLAYGLRAVVGDAFAGPPDHARLLYGGSEESLQEVGRRLAGLGAFTGP